MSSDLAQRLRDAAGQLRGGEANPARGVMLEAAEALESLEPPVWTEPQTPVMIEVPDAEPERGADGGEQPSGETDRSDAQSPAQ